MSVRKDIGRGHDRVLDILSGCRDFDEVAAAGVLFHGTCEDLAGDLRPGGYDDVFWTAQAPNVAQAYIPRAGVRTMIGAPSDFRRDEYIRPARPETGFVTRWAMERAGVASLDELDVEWDGWTAKSFIIRPGWPTEGDLEIHLRELGYEQSASGIYDVSMSRDAGGDVAMPADWRMPGHLVIAAPRTLAPTSPDWSAEALGYRPHNRVADFRRFAEEGIGAFRMEDKLQSEDWGNVTHLSVGVTPSGLDDLDWIAIPATRHDGPDHDVWHYPETAEFVAFMREIAPGYEPGGPYAAAGDEMEMAP